MPATDLKVTGGELSFSTRGLARTFRALEKAGVDAADLRGAMRRIGHLVVVAARPRVPVLDGALRSSLRAGESKTRAAVHVGGARAKHAPFVHYGVPALHITKRPFLRDTVQDQAPAIYQAIEDEIATILARNHLK